MKTTKPQIFISSTIYDFYDLRSALKFYLESLGYEVFLSEYNDFPKEMDKNSYEECLKTIENANYFILLVGSRVGGFYDEAKKISITEKEYEKAYEQLEKGSLKLINIVRENLWVARNERKSLEKILVEEYKAKHELTDEDIQSLKNFKSDITNNAEYTFKFLNKIARVEEMKKAQASSNDFPIGNWIHTFKTFGDIVDVLKKEFSFSENIESMALKENLKYEILENLKICFQKFDNGEIYKINTYANRVFKKYKDEFKGASTFSHEDFKMFPLYLMFGIGLSSNLKTEFIDNALKSGKFLDYNNNTGRFEQSIFSKSLLKLKGYIEGLKNLESFEQLNVENRIKLCDEYKINSDQYSISNTLLLLISQIYHLQNQIVELSYALFLNIEGAGLLEEYNYDEKILSKMGEELKAEKITESDLMKFLQKKIEKAQKK